MIEVKGLDGLVKNLSKYSDLALKGVVAACQITQAIIVNDARADHPYKDRTGNLTNSIQAGDVIIDDKEVTVYVQARMQYASFVEFGTSRAQAYPFLTPAMLRNAANFRKTVAEQIGKIKL